MTTLCARKKGFTLIELLVVVAIIVLLVAILIPSLGKARDVARTAVCNSNLRQISMGTLTYSTEFGGSMLPWTTYSATASYHMQTPYWDQYLYRYLIGQLGTTAGAGNSVNLSVGKLFLCPSVTKLASNTWGGGNNFAPNMWRSYQINGFVSGSDGTYTMTSGSTPKISGIVSPGQVVMYGEREQGWALNDGYEYKNTTSGLMADQAWMWPQGNHSIMAFGTIVGGNLNGQLATNSLLNTAFMDGHAASVKFTKSSSNALPNSAEWVMNPATLK